MSVFSHAFVRKRMISLATTTLVAVMSMAFTRNPTPRHDPLRLTPISHTADRLTGHEEPRLPSDSDIAISRMMADMTAKSARSVDHHFAATMRRDQKRSVDMTTVQMKRVYDEQLHQAARHQAKPARS
jgi:hypothetical protein